MANLSEAPACPVGAELLEEMTASLNAFRAEPQNLDVSLEDGDLPLFPLLSSDSASVVPRDARKYKPRVGEARAKNIIAQKTYRKQRKDREVQVHAALESARSELESLRIEHGHLTQENRALETLGQYSESLFEYLRCATSSLREGSTIAIGSTASAVQGPVAAMITSLREKLWANLIAPSEREMRVLACFLTGPALRCTFLPFYIRVSSSVVEWCVVPSQRPDIERRLQSLFDTRVRCCFDFS